MSVEPVHPEFPRADFAHDLGDIRAWLTDEERAALAAINCPDIVTTTGTNLRLREDQERTASGRRRRTPRHKLTPEQEEREKVASGHMEACFKAYTNPRAWLYRIGIARKEGHDFRMALLNERGEGEPPAPHWKWTVGAWVRTDGLVVARDEDEGWCFAAIPGVYLYPQPNTARETMQQADTKLPLADTAPAAPGCTEAPHG